MRSVIAAATTSVLACSLVACTIEEPELSTTDQPVGSWNRLAGNRLAGNRLAANRLAGNRLAGNALSTTTLEALDATAEILETAEGRDVYSYIVSCALDASITIHADIPGPSFPDTSPPMTPYTCVANHCTFVGNLNLAPKWKDKKLDAKGRAWVSACLFSRVNAHDTAEAISLRGTNAGLTVTLSEMELYTQEEGAFYGNLFVDDPNPNAKPDWNACRGQAKAANPDSGGLALRDCAQEDPANPGYTYCGFNYAGDCRDFTPSFPSPYACRTFDSAAGVYGDCYEEPVFNAKSKCTKKYREVITTWVAN